MLGLIKKTIKDKKVSFLAFSLASIAFLEMYLALFPTVQKQGAEMAKLMETFPETFLQAFNIDKASLTFSDVAPYLAMEMFNFIWPIFAIIIGISFANYSIAGEIERGTMGVLLSQPISRLKLYFVQFFSGLSLIGAFTIVTVFAIAPLSAFHGIDYSFSNVAALALLSFLFAAAIYCLAFFVSSLVSDRSKVSFTVGGALVVMYVLNILAGLKDSLSGLQYFSFFYYYDPNLALSRGLFVEWSWVVFVGIGLLAVLAGAFCFQKRDVSV